MNIKKENALRQKKTLKIDTHKISFMPIKENIASDWENIFRRKPFSFTLYFQIYDHETHRRNEKKYNVPINVIINVL